MRRVKPALLLRVGRQCDTSGGAQVLDLIELPFELQSMPAGSSHDDAKCHSQTCPSRAASRTFPLRKRGKCWTLRSLSCRNVTAIR